MDTKIIPISVSPTSTYTYYHQGIHNIVYLDPL